MSLPDSSRSLERAEQAIAVMAVFMMDAASIASACSSAAPHWSVVAVVDWELRTSLWTVPDHALAQQQPVLEGDGWSLSFPSGTSEADIRETIARTARVAEARRDALARYLERHPSDD